jgi:hypothetical protein
MSRSFGGRSFTTRSPIEIVPPVISSSPAIDRSAVDFPHHELALPHLKVQVVERFHAAAVNLLHVLERDTRHSETSMSGPCPRVGRRPNR